MAVQGESRMLIDGKLTDASSGTTFDNVNPATEEVIGQVADGTEQDMRTAIEAARRAFDETDWSTNRAFRKRCLQQLRDALDREKETLRPQIVAEVGTPIGLTYAIQQDTCIEDLQWDIDQIDRVEWDRELGVHEFFGMRSRRVVTREAVGVVGAITPWNFPFMLNLSKLGPALAAGNTVVLKPAPDTPWSATFIGKVALEQTDIPPGVLNVVTSGDPAAVGEVRQGPRDDEKRRLHVHREQPVELLGRAVRHRDAAAHFSGVVHQDVQVDRTRPLLQALLQRQEELAHVAGNPELGLHGEGPAAVLLDRRHGFRRGVFPGRIVHRDQASLAGQSDGDLPAESPARARHQGRLVCEPVHVVLPVSLPRKVFPIFFGII